MTKFIYDDFVLIVNDAAAGVPAGTRGSVIAVFATADDRPGASFERFPSGPVYTLELADGSTVEAHESWLAAA